MPEYVRLPDGRTLELPDNMSQEQQSQLDAMLAEDFPEEFGEGFDSQENTTVFGTVKETIKAVPRGFMQGLGMTAEGLLSLGGMDDDNPMLDAVQDWTDSWNDSIGEGYEDSWAVKFGTGIGNVGSFFAPMVLSGGLSAIGSGLGAASRVGQTANIASNALKYSKYGIPISTVPLAVGMGASEQLDYRERAREKGIEISGGEQFLSKLSGGAIGLTELAPLWRLFRKIPKTAEGKVLVDDALSQLLGSQRRAYLAGSVGAQALAEGIQEAGAGLLQRAVAKGLYDPTLDIGESIFDEFTVGGAVGATVDLLSETMLPRSRYRMGFDDEGKAIPLSEVEINSTEEQNILAEEQERIGVKKLKNQHKVYDQNIVNFQPSVVEDKSSGLFDIVDLNDNSRILGTYNTEEQANINANKLIRAVSDAKKVAQTSKDAYELGVEGNSSAQTILIQTSAPEYSSISKTELAQDLYGLGKDEVPNKEYRLALNNKLRSRISKIKNKEVKNKLERNIPFTFEEAIKYRLLPNKQSISDFFARRAEFSNKKQGKGALKRARTKSGNITVNNVQKILNSKNITSKVNSKEFQAYALKVTGAKKLTEMTKGQKELLVVRLADIPKQRTPGPMIDVSNVLEKSQEQSKRFDRRPLDNLLNKVREEQTDPNNPIEYTRKQISEYSGLKGAEATQLINRLLSSKRLTKKGNKYIFFDGSLKTKNNQPVINEDWFKKYSYENGTSFMETPQEYAQRLSNYKIGNQNMFTREEVNNLVNFEGKRKGTVNKRGLSDVQEANLKERLVAGNMRGEVPLTSINRSTDEIFNRERMADKIGKDIEKSLSKLIDKKHDVRVALSPIMRSKSKQKKVGELGKDEGAYYAPLNTIFLNIEAVDPDLNLSEGEIKARLEQVLNHEVVHALKNLDLFTNKEWENLVNSSKRILVPEATDSVAFQNNETFYDRARKMYGDRSIPVQEEEAVAELYRAWSKDAKLLSGQPRSVMQRILDFFQNLIKGLKQSDLSSVEVFATIATRLQAGEIGGRDIAVETGEEAVGALDDSEEEDLYENTYKTEDGYILIKQEDGTLTDGDITFNSLSSLKKDTNVVKLKEPKKYITEDGYVFVEKSDGSLTDGDITVDSLSDLKKGINPPYTNISVSEYTGPRGDDIIKDKERIRRIKSLISERKVRPFEAGRGFELATRSLIDTELQTELPQGLFFSRITMPKAPGPQGAAYEYLNNTGQGYPLMSEDKVAQELIKIYEEMRANGNENSFGQAQVEQAYEALGLTMPEGINVPSIGSLMERVTRSFNEGNDYDWYRKLGRSIEALVGRPNMVEFSVVFGITSAQNPPNKNLRATLEVMNRVRQILASGQTYSVESLTTNLHELIRKYNISEKEARSIARTYVNGEWDVKTLTSAKTPTYVRSLFLTSQGEYFPFGVMDTHMGNAYGVTPLDPKTDKRRKLMFNTNEQGVLQFINTVLSTKRYEVNDTRGGKKFQTFAPDEIQALIWFDQRSNEDQYGEADIESLLQDSLVAPAVKKSKELMEKGLFNTDQSLDIGLQDISDILYKGRQDFLSWDAGADPLYYLQRAVAPQIAVSPKLGSNIYEGDLELSQWEKLSDEIFNAITIESNGRPQIKFLKDLGIPHEIQKTYGGWGAVAEPTYLVTLPGMKVGKKGSEGEVESIAKILASALHQDAVVTIQPDYGGDNTGVIVRKENNEPFTRQDAEAITKGMNDLDGQALGFTFNVIPEDNSVYFIDDTLLSYKVEDVPQEVIYNRVNTFKDHIEKELARILQTPVILDNFFTDGDYYAYEEGDYRDGFEGLQRFSSVSKSPNIQTAANNTLFEPISRVLNQFYEEEGLVPPPQGFSQVDKPNSALYTEKSTESTEQYKIDLEESNEIQWPGGIPPYNLRNALPTSIDSAGKQLNSDNDFSFKYDETIDDDYKASRQRTRDEFDDFGTGFKPIKFAEDQTVPFGRKLLNTLTLPFQFMRGKNADPGENFFNEKTFTTLRQRIVDRHDAFRKVWAKTIGKAKQMNMDEADIRILHDANAVGALTFADRARGHVSAYIKQGGVLEFVKSDGKGGILPANDYKSGGIQRVPKYLEDGSLVDMKELMALLHTKNAEGKEILLDEHFGNYMIWRRIRSLQANEMFEGSELFKQLEATGKLKDFLNDDYFSQLTNKYPQLIRAAEIYDAINDSMIELARKTGLITDEKAAIFTELSSFYPFYREHENIDTPGYGIFNTDEMNRQFSVFDQKVDPENIGGDFQNPLEAMVLNHLSLATAAAKNVARQRIVDDLEFTKELKPEGVTSPNNIENLVIDLGPKKDSTSLKRKLEQGIDVDGTNIPIDSSQLISVKRNGEEHIYYIDDPAILYSLETMGEPILKGFLRFVGAPSAVLREMVTRDPGFIMVNMMRDTLSAYTTSGADIKPFISTINGFFSEISELEALGVVGGYDLAGDPKDFMKFINKEMRRMGRDKNGGLDTENAVVRIWDALGRVTTKSDAATRQAVYQDVLKKTGNRIEAAFQALEIINFNRRGGDPLFKVLTTAIPFLNARIQGLDVLYRAGAGRYSANVMDTLTEEGKKQIKNAAARRFFNRLALLIGVTALYWLFVSDSEEYKELNAKKEIRDDNYIIPLGDRYSFKIPIPFEVGVLTKVLPERFFNLFLGDDNINDFAQATWRQAETTFKVNPFNWQIWAPLQEAFNNKSDYTGREIVPYWMLSSRIPEERYTDNTQLWARTLGAALNISPMKIEHVGKGYFGTLGGYALDLTDRASRMATGTPQIPMGFHNAYVVKRFIGDRAYGGGLVQDFYQMRGELDRLVGTMNELRKQGRLEDVEALMQSHGDLYKQKGRLRWIERYLSKWRQRRNLVMRDKTIDSDTRKALIEQMNLERDRVLMEVPKIKKTVGSPLWGI